MAGHLVTINMEVIEEAKQLMGERFSIMVEYFLEDAQMYISEIETGLETKDLDKASAAAHTIKSSSRQIGAERVSDTSEKIENLCRVISEGEIPKEDLENNFIELESLSVQLKEEMEEVTPELNSL